MGELLAKLTGLALAVPRLGYPPTEPLRARADSILWNPTLGLRLLGIK